MNKINKILIVLLILLFAVSPVIAGKMNNDPLFILGNADRQFGSITCYLGQLFPGQPIEFCGWDTPEGFVMFHSYFIYQQKQMIEECTAAGGVTVTYTFRGK